MGVKGIYFASVSMVFQMDFDVLLFFFILRTKLDGALAGASYTCLSVLNSHQFYHLQFF